MRKHSSQKLLKLLARQKEPLRILEIGCGNGWLCNQLASIKDANITGLDINIFELEQAERVFAKANLGFIYGDIFEDILPLKSFDAIILGSSIQYFEDVTNLIDRLLSLLDYKGEIHVFDSPVYKTPKKAAEAKERSAKYFGAMGAKDMAHYYKHHTYDSLNKFNYSLIRPKLHERLLGMSRFPWIVIKQG